GWRRFLQRINVTARDVGCGLDWRRSPESTSTGNVTKSVHRSGFHPAGPVIVRNHDPVRAWSSHGDGRGGRWGVMDASPGSGHRVQRLEAGGWRLKETRP